MEIVLTIGIFGVCAVLLSVGIIFAGKSVRPKCSSEGLGDHGEGCQFCGTGSPGVCAKESSEAAALLDATLVEPPCKVTK